MMQPMASSDVRVIPISELRRDRVYQVRGDTFDDTVADYVTIVKAWQGRIAEARVNRQKVDKIPPPFMDPVTVACILHPGVSPKGRPWGPLTEIPEGALVLVDGWHRVEACEIAGREEIEARTVECTVHEALLLAALGNARHGRRLDAKGMREQFRLYVHGKGHVATDGKFKRYEDIAAELGGSRNTTTLFRWMKTDFPKLAKAMGRPGGGSQTAVRHAAPIRPTLRDDPVIAVINAWRGLDGYRPETRRALVNATRELLGAAEAYADPIPATEGDF